MTNKFQKEIYLYDQLDEFKAKCNTCLRNCEIHSGNLGTCRTRINLNGKIYCLNYGLISSLSINPIEKKPLFHYYPGTYALTIGSYSCNFECPWCQNWSISKTYPNDIKDKKYISPDDLIRTAENDDRIQGISFSFNEPTLWLEYILDVFEACNPRLYRMLVTNGYMSTEALDLLIGKGMTGMSVTVKGNAETVKKYCGAEEDSVWRNIKRAHERGIHLEIIYLVIPRINDSTIFIQELSNKLVDIDPNIPIHFTRFFPDFKFNNVDPTPITKLEEAYRIARKHGLNYVYLGNLFGHPFENTYCPECNTLLIERIGYEIKNNLLSTNKCPSCAKEIKLVSFS